MAWDFQLCMWLEYSMSVKLLTEHNLEFLSLKGGCTGSSESPLVKVPDCWKSHAAAPLLFNLLEKFSINLLEKFSIAYDEFLPVNKDGIEMFFYHLTTVPHWLVKCLQNTTFSIISDYGKCSLISNTFLFLFPNKMLVGCQGWNSQMIVRITNREDLFRSLHFCLRLFCMQLALKFKNF